MQRCWRRMLESDYQTRFGGLGRLLSTDALQRLSKAHACVIGVGGVGSWTVEALARSGIGELTLIDLDEVCVSNVNRQIHALEGAIGRPKVQVMAERARAIAPGLKVNEAAVFYTRDNADEVLNDRFDMVVDAIDSGQLKAHLIGTCRRRGLPIMTCGGAGGRKDASRVKVTDLGRASGDPLLAKVRRELRTHFGFPKYAGKRFGVPCVYSDEPPRFPWADGRVCAQREPGSDVGLNCEEGMGTAAWVTGTIGLIAAQVAIEAIVSPEPHSPKSAR